MLIIPAIDIIDGKCVRLTQGDYASKKVYDTNPLKVAQRFESQGADRLHIVDLDGAKIGQPINQNLILKLRESLSIPMEVGGGIRSIKDATAYLDAGINQIVFGSKSVADIDFLKILLFQYGADRIIVSIDIKGTNVVTEGWQKENDLNYLDFSKKLKAIGIQEVICTDIARDGTLSEPNMKPFFALQALDFRVIASGGVSSPQSLVELRNAGLYGAIIGKALYEKKLSLNEALVLARPSGLAKRIIPCLDIQNGRVVKGVGFKNLKDAGDPVEVAKRYCEEGADELVFLDITATVEKRKTLVDLVRKVAKAITIPFCVGGGIGSLEDIKALLEAGADKISIGSAAVANPELIRQASQRFGSQCIVISIDAKKVGCSWLIYTHGGRSQTLIDAIEFAQAMERLGAGELLVNSLDRDGTNQGYDLDLLKAISSRARIPVIASSGAGSKKDFKKALTVGGCDAALAASLFHYGILTITDVKQYLSDNNLTIRL